MLTNKWKALKRVSKTIQTPIRIQEPRRYTHQGSIVTVEYADTQSTREYSYSANEIVRVISNHRNTTTTGILLPIVYRFTNSLTQISKLRTYLFIIVTHKQLII